MRERRGEARTLAREQLRIALDLCPGWVAPRRMQDELAREDLEGIAALAEHLDALARAPDAATSYLAGRLEGLAGHERFARAVRIDPDLAWGHHGLAFAAAQRGDARAAVEHARAAHDRARDPSERAFFVASLARFLAQIDESDEALDVLDAALEHDGLRPLDRADVVAERVRIGLVHEDARERRDAYERGLELLADPACDDARVDETLPRLLLAPSIEDLDRTRLGLSLSLRASPARDRWRAHIELARAPSPLALGLLERARAASPDVAVDALALRRARCAAGDIERGIEAWVEALPPQVLAPDGTPADERLAEVQRRARALASAATAERDAALASLCEAFLDAGWFHEARAAASRLAGGDLERALELDARAAAGIALFEELERLASRTDPTRAAREDGPERITSLVELLEALAGPLARADAFLGGATDRAQLARELVEGPRMRYGGFGELVHPGPRFSAADADDGLGARDAEVGGLAAALRRFGRFALVGEVVGGGGPDLSVLPLVRLEQRAGEHLGVPWSGTIAWCEEADVGSRAARAGAAIGGAALHEGYWIDLSVARGEHASWTSLRARFANDRERVERALAVRGLPVAQGASARAERTSASALLGEGRRVRLALLRDRARDGEVLGEIALGEVVDAVARHEEGHLCDRTRFLPLSRHLWKALAMLVEARFSPRSVNELLEYRAQLTSLCVTEDPRVALAQILDASEDGGGGVTAHAAAYRRLLADWLRVLDDELARDPAAYAALDRGRTLVHQVHALSAEDVRRVSRALAKRTF